MPKGLSLLIAALVVIVGLAQAQGAGVSQILPGPLTKLDIKDAIIEATRGVPRRTFTIVMHFALDPTWLEQQDHIVARTQQHYDYLVHDALIKAMPQGLLTYSLAEHAEATADFSKVAFRLRDGLTFHDGQPLTTTHVAWSYQSYRGVNAKLFKDKLDSLRSDGGVELVDERILTDLRAVGIRAKLQTLEGPIFRSKTGQGRKGYEGNRTIVQNIDLRAGGAKASIEVYAVCAGGASFICEPAIEERWKQHEASVNAEDRDRLIKEVQRLIIQEYYFVPIYINPFVHAVGPRVLPAGDAPAGEGFHRYWTTPLAGYPYPWEDWQVRE